MISATKYTLLGVFGLFAACGTVEATESCLPNDPSLGCQPIAEGASCREHFCDSSEECAIRTMVGFCFDPLNGGCIAQNASAASDPCLVCDTNATQNALVAKECGGGEVCQAGNCVAIEPDADAATDTSTDADVAEPQPDVVADADVAEPQADVAAEVDATPDAGPDDSAGPDPAPDASPDAGADAEPDAVTDALPDATTDTQDTDIGAETDSGPGASYLVYPGGLTTLGPSGASGGYILHDHRFVYSPTCSTGGEYCAVGGLAP